MTTKREWSTSSTDVYGHYYSHGDIVKGRALTGILWKDVIGQIVEQDDRLFLKGKDVYQTTDYVNMGEIIGNIYDSPELLEELE